MLKVLKGFRHEGVDYRPGEDCPAGLDARTKELLIRTRHLHDPKAKAAPRASAALQVTKNPDFDPSTYVVAGLTCPTCFARTGRSTALDKGRCWTCGYNLATDGATPAGSPTHLAGRALALAQDWGALAGSDQGVAPARPGIVVTDRAPADALAGRKLAQAQDWGAPAAVPEKG